MFLTPSLTQPTFSLFREYKFLQYSILIARLSIDFNEEYMLQVNPANRPDIREVLTGLEAIAIAMDVDLKGKVVM